MQHICLYKKIQAKSCPRAGLLYNLQFLQCTAVPPVYSSVMALCLKMGWYLNLHPLGTYIQTVKHIAPWGTFGNRKDRKKLYL
jgi:hypothetical protein